ncbi:MAG: thiamine-phosphate kinase [Candidatus Omnitrophota bacterium]
MEKTLKEIGEIGLIERIAKQSRCDRSVIKGIGDDTAVIKWTKDKYLLFTCDMMIEDVHFARRKATPFQIGWKALGRNISDIAAMGGVARYALVSIGLDPDLPLSFADGILEGINALAKKFKVNIVGGDTARSKKLVIDISLIGEVEKERLALRSGAKCGDAIFVTGFIGGSGKGKHLDFTPRLDAARALVKNFKVNSMIDVSDGLLLDLWRVLEASGAGAVVYEDLVPVSKDARSTAKAMTDGEDFELLFTLGAKEAERFMRSYLKKLDIPVSLIGEVVPKKYGYRLIGNDWKEKRITRKGYTHF